MWKRLTLEPAPLNVTVLCSASRIFEDASYETTGSELVIPLFGDAHSVYGYTGTQRPMLNTGNASTSLTDIYTLEVIIKLKKCRIHSQL